MVLALLLFVFFSIDLVVVSILLGDLITTFFFTLTFLLLLILLFWLIFSDSLINGFICLRSVLFFGISALVLVYIIKPFCIKLAQNKNSKKFMIICLIIVSIFLLDEFYNLYFHKLLNLPRAIEIYKSIGFHFM